MKEIKRALISVTDKSGLKELVAALHERQVEIISTGGTAKKIQEMGIPITPIEKVTGNPEAFGGRMKTISFQIGSALLFKREDQDHQAQAKDLGVEPIDLVVCNLYQFEKAARENAELDQLIEQIDIGGPSMIRAAAKNHESISVLTGPSQYGEFIQKFKTSNIDQNYNKALALSAFQLTSRYDEMIFKTLSNAESASAQLTNKKKLRYGENPHQSANLFKLENTNNQSLVDAKIHQGKELSYNNILDLDAAWKSCYDAYYSVEKDALRCVSLVKHLNPAGLALAHSKTQALKLAWAGDPVSAFGSIICFNYEVELEQAKWLSDKFIEIVVAPSFAPEALEAFSKKKNLRVIELAPKKRESIEQVYRSVSGAMLVQEEDHVLDRELQFVTKKKFDEELLPLARFGGAACKHLKSNAICLVSQTDEGDFWLTGAGMGQPNRLDSLRQLTIPRFRDKKDAKIEESIMVSDAFFPFRDSVDTANEYNIKNIVQPGGSIKDKEVIAACDEFGIAMAFTGRRHFRH